MTIFHHFLNRFEVKNLISIDIGYMSGFCCDAREFMGCLSEDEDLENNDQIIYHC